MPTPEFILTLRKKIGHDPLFLTCAGGVVLDGAGRILLEQRGNTGRWTVPGGILEPGEQPAEALAREILEETGVVASVDLLTAVQTGPPLTLPNADQVQFVDLWFRCSYLSGDARVGDDESLDVGWFDPAALPDSVSAERREMIARAIACDGSAWFAPHSP